MGVPKFYRFLVERFPLIRQVLEQDPVVPEYDGLYLDMNGIVHQCTHANEEGLSYEIDEGKVFVKIFNYIDYVFHLVRPRQILYMAIDGVAPRAKMNQQRERRFASARDQQEAFDKAVMNGEYDSDRKLFDSNVITPGTEFMHRLTSNLEYFVRSKIQSDRAWRRVEVVISGHQVPGEGEHKIMDYIRRRREVPGHDPRESYCIYGLDADLIMLALVSHEPRFSLLREEVRFGRPQSEQRLRFLEKTDNAQFQEKFELVHVSVLRDYLQDEFGCLKEPLEAANVQGFEFDFERILDDFVFMCMLVGNDFLPCLPYLDIANGSLNFLFSLYKALLPQLRGYLCNCGNIQWEQFELFLKEISRYELSIITDEDASSTSSGGRRMRGKKTNKVKQYHFDLLPTSTDEQFMPELDEMMAGMFLPDDEGENGSGEEEVGNGTSLKSTELVKSSTPAFVFAGQDGSGLSSLGQSSRIDSELHSNWKILYYRNKRVKTAVSPEEVQMSKLLAGKCPRRILETGKMCIPPLDDEEKSCVRRAVRAYVYGLAWVLGYYYKGCVSWSWFYDQRYAPLASDFVNLKEFTPLSFDKSTPFLPFQQLLCVLPAKSARFLPAPYGELMKSATSPIIDFYPLTFKVDMDGKRNSWEGHALLPLIDERRLLDSFASVSSDLVSRSESARNVISQAFVIRAVDKSATSFPSPLEGFPPIENCRSIRSEFVHPCGCNIDAHVHDYECQDSFCFRPALCEGWSLDCFPTMSTLPHRIFLQSCNLCVFGRPSQRESCVVQVLPPQRFFPVELETVPVSDRMVRMADTGELLERVADAILGNVVYGHWPLKTEMLVSGVSSEEASIGIGQARTTKDVGPRSSWIRRRFTDQERTQFRKLVDSDRNDRMSRQAVNVGQTRIVVSAQRLTGMTRDPDGSSSKLFDDSVELFPLQLIIDPDIVCEDPRFVANARPPQSKRTPVGSMGVFLGPEFHGSLVHVVSIDDDEVDSLDGMHKLTVEIEVLPSLPPAQNFHSVSVAAQQSKMVWYPNREVARYLKMRAESLSKLTGSLSLTDIKENLGLALKLSGKGLGRPGWTRRRGDDWEFSEQCVQQLFALYKEFPELFVAVGALYKGAFSTTSQEVFPGLKPEAARHRAVACARYIQKMPHMKEPLQSTANSSQLESTGVKSLQDVGKRFQWLRQRWQQRETRSGVDPSDVYFPHHSEFAFGDILRSMSDEDNGSDGNGKGALPKADSAFAIGDRVVTLADMGLIPFGRYGTIVGTRPLDVDIVFDEPFMSGTDLGGKCLLLHGATVKITSSALLKLQPQQSTSCTQRSSRQTTTGSRSALASPAPPVASASAALSSVAPALPSGGHRGEQRHRQQQQQSEMQPKNRPETATPPAQFRSASSTKKEEPPRTWSSFFEPPAPKQLVSRAPTESRPVEQPAKKLKKVPKEVPEKTEHGGQVEGAETENAPSPVLKPTGRQHIPLSALLPAVGVPADSPAPLILRASESEIMETLLGVRPASGAAKPPVQKAQHQPPPDSSDQSGVETVFFSAMLKAMGAPAPNIPTKPTVTSAVEDEWVVHDGSEKLKVDANHPMAGTSWQQQILARGSAPRPEGRQKRPKHQRRKVNRSPRTKE